MDININSCHNNTILNTKISIVAHNAITKKKQANKWHVEYLKLSFETILFYFDIKNRFFHKKNKLRLDSYTFKQCVQPYLATCLANMQLLQINSYNLLQMKRFCLNQ